MKLKVYLTCCSCFVVLATTATAQPFFVDVTEQVARPLVRSRSAAWGDWNNDGWPDLFFAEGASTNPVTLNRPLLLGNQQGRRFVDRTQAIRNLEDFPTETAGGGSVWGDYDGDGDLDLFVSIGSFWGGFSRLGRSRNVLLRNDDGIFTDVAAAAGLKDPHPTDNAVWWDYDLDGHLDLYTGNLNGERDADGTYRSRNILYRNRGDGTFEDATAAVGLDEELQACCGGSNGGILGSDLNGDGWPDLYLGLFQSANRLYFNEGGSAFVDASATEVADGGEAHGIAAGDIDNDLDIDIFQSAGRDQQVSRSRMLLNLGDGQLADVTEGVGLTQGGLPSFFGATFGDIDNDGDLDLVTTGPHRLFLNDGNGVFSERTADSGIDAAATIVVALGDYDLDGCLDAAVGEHDPVETGKIYRNACNDNHYLRVELAGIASNSAGIGARVVAESGDLRQMREIFGGLGMQQDEMVAHFGLGGRQRVERLEIRWPSGTVDVLEGVEADQKIRVVEGSGTYQRVVPLAVEWDLADSLVNSGQEAEIAAAVQPALFDANAVITAVTADLSAVGGPAALALDEDGSGSYRLRETVRLPGGNGPRFVSVLVEQETTAGRRWSRPSRPVALLPAGDEAVSGREGPWQVALRRGEAALEARFTQVDGTRALEMASPVTAAYLPEDGLEPFGYQSLRFALHPGNVSAEIDQQSDIVFATDRDGNFEIYGMDANGGHVVNLTRHPGQDGGYRSAPAWSPDGRRIAFSTDRDGNAEVYVMEADGSNPVNLSKHPNFDAAPSFSPDGRWIAFASDRAEPGEDPRDEDALLAGRGNLDIYVMRADGTDPRRLTTALGVDNAPRWSPDGSRIAFLSNRDGNYEIYAMNADGSGQTRLTDHPGVDVLPWWSPDGSKIAFLSFRDGTQNVHIMNADGSDVQRLTSNAADDGSPTWSPDGEQIAFVSNRDGNWEIYVMNADGSGPARLTIHPAQDGFPAWSPRGGVVGQVLDVGINGRTIRLDLGSSKQIGVDLARKEWQTVDIPLSLFNLDGPIEEISFRGELGDTFYLGEVRLVAQTPAEATAVLEDYDGTTPEAFALEQNYPNPFNSGTVIPFALPKAGEVELAVYNLAGQKVVTLVEGERAAGSYKITWDGRDKAGRALATGMYLYELRREGRLVQTRKLLLLR